MIFALISLVPSTSVPSSTQVEMPVHVACSGFASIFKLLSPGKSEKVLTTSPICTKRGRERVVDVLRAKSQANFTMVFVLLGTTRAFVLRRCDNTSCDALDTSCDALASMSRLRHMFTSRDGASCVCVCVCVLPRGFVVASSWLRCGFVVASSWLRRGFVSVTMVLTLKKECIELSSVYM